MSSPVPRWKGWHGVINLKRLWQTHPTLAQTLVKLQPESRLYAYRLLLEKAKLEEPPSVTEARLKRRTA